MNGLETVFCRLALHKNSILESQFPLYLKITIECKLNSEPMDGARS